MRKKAAAPDFRVCPACGARNKAKWEFCARCGENLEGVALGEPPAAAGAADVAGPAPQRAPASAGAGGILSVLVAVVALGAAVYFLRNPPGPEEPPDPGLFTAPSLPAPPAPPQPERPQDEAQKLFIEGRTLLLKNKPQDALDPLSRAIGLAGDRAEYHAAYGQALWQSGQREEGVAAAERAAGLEPTAERWSQVARMKEQLGDQPGAEQAYESALEADPDRADVLRTLATKRTKAGRHADAVPLLSRLAALKPEDLVIAQELAFALDKTGNPDAAVAEYRKILDRVPEAHLTRGLLAEALFTRGDHNGAIGLFREGLAATPEAALLHRGLGSVLERDGQREAAAEAYRRYAELAPNAGDAKKMVERADFLTGKSGVPSPATSGS